MSHTSQFEPCVCTQDGLALRQGRAHRGGGQGRSKRRAGRSPFRSCRCGLLIQHSNGSQQCFHMAHLRNSHRKQIVSVELEQYIT
jgi:hypothetical protein